MNRLVRTRMLGGVGAGGVKPPGYPIRRNGLLVIVGPHTNDLNRLDIIKDW